MLRGEHGSFAVVTVSKETAERLLAARSAPGSVAPLGAVSPRHGQWRSPCLPGSSPAPPCWTGVPWGCPECGLWGALDPFCSVFGLFLPAASLQQWPEQWLGLGYQPAAGAMPPQIHSPAAGFCFEALVWWKRWGVWKQLHH